ncbi:pVIII [Bovine adenovirus 7]|nr:pVIII [Bovine adenovirus 7]
MAQPVTPYIWRYQPETGYTAGAHQNYSAVINWLQANPQMVARIKQVNLVRNDLDKLQANITRQDISANVNNWPAKDLYQPLKAPYIPASPNMATTINDFEATRQGIQLSGNQPLKGTGSNALSSYPDIPDILKYSRVGQQLQGYGTFSKDNIHLFYEGSRQPRKGGLSPVQFINEFPPVVYQNPFSGPLRTFPKEFNPLFSPEKDFRPTTNETLKYQ